MNVNFDSEETLPNGIYVRKFIETQGEFPWIASINIGPWHYSQGGFTRDDAIANIFAYMKEMQADFADRLKRDYERLETLNKFLAPQEIQEFCECSYPTADHITYKNNTCSTCGKVVRIYDE